MPSPRVLAPALAALAPALALAACGGSSSGARSSPPASATRTATTSAPASSTDAGSGSSSASAPSFVSATARGVTASMSPHSHHPVAERPWPISFTVTRAGAPVRASVRYEYLFGGQVVARRSHYTFDGRFSDVFRWPDQAVGYPLTFRAVIEAQGVTLSLDYPVQVAR